MRLRSSSRWLLKELTAAVASMLAGNRLDLELSSMSCHV